MSRPANAPASPPRRLPRALKIALAIVALAAVAIAALVGYGLSERGLPFVVARIVAQTGGRITVEEPSGSAAGTMRFRRITWHGTDITVTADDVVVDWDPRALLGQRLAMRGLGARRVDIEIKPSPGATPPPTDLRLPLAVDIGRLAVAELRWRTGPRGGHISGLAFGYAGDAQMHRIRDLRLVSDYGSLAGDLDVGAREPLTVAGHATIVGDAMLAGARAEATLTGPLARIGIAAKGTLREAALSLEATATPFATAPFATALVELGGVDAASFDASLPHTRGRMRIDAAPYGDGVAGTLDIVNDDAGPLDADRLPLARLASRFALTSTALTLGAIDAAIPGGGGARGEARIALDGAQRTAHFALAVSDLDLARIDTRLVATRLAGRIAGDADAKRQSIEGDVRDRDRTLAFAAIVEGVRVDVTRFQASTAAGSLRGSARLTLNDENAFAVQATMQRLDPSRFAALPAAALDGSVDATGVLRPRWRARADVRLAPTSRLAGIALSGHATGIAAPGSIRDAVIDIALGSARIEASGAAGLPGDRLAIRLDAPQVAEVAALLPAAVPRPLAGAIHASGSVSFAGAAAGGDVEIHASGLQAGPYAAAALEGRASIAPAAARAHLDERAVALDVTATKLTLPGREFDTAHATASGTFAQHRATLAFSGGDVDAAMTVTGSLRGASGGAPADWSGTLVTFDNRGSVPVRLLGSAALEIRRGYAQLRDAQVEIADGRADIGEFTWAERRITTHGSFTGIPLASAAKLAGHPLPAQSTLVLGGDWTIAAEPRLNGRFGVHRERGDIVADLAVDGTTQPQDLGITSLAASGTFHDDALDASISFASARAGSANGTLAIGSVAGAAPGTIDRSAPLRLALRADLGSLVLIQPLFGTDAAVNGRAQVDVAAAGTVGDPLWSGTLRGEALRIDAPRYGVHASDGDLRAHLTSAGIVLDDASFHSGDGTFVASGLIALPGARGEARSHVTWKADRFRAANRPDLRLIVSGEGAVALANRRLELSGRLAIVEGHVEYEPTPSGQLASDIVIEGRSVASRQDSRDVPVVLDVDVDLGNALTFTGEGLDTRLAGRVRITTAPGGTLLGRGTIRAVNGTYYAFGQKLTIDRGRLIFDGPLDNPALDVVALRKNLAVEAGVALTGTVKVPQVRITSNPPVSENEALAWLVTGQGLNTSSRVDYAALSAASAALLGRGGKPLTTEIAQRLGLDDISLQSGAASGTDGTASQVVVFGKRISDRLSLGYEQGLSLASSALRLEYALSRRVTLRAEAGVVSGVGIVYRRNFQ